MTTDRSDPNPVPAPSAPELTAPPAARSSKGFYGWRIVVFASVVVAMTAPGQTAAVSAFIDPMMTELGLSRSAISTAYLVGTLLGAVAMPQVGRLLDRFGVRRTMAVIGLVFGAVLLGLALVSNVVGLTAGFVGIRMAGQGALGLTATTAAALWFQRRRGLATGIVGAVGATGISLAPIGLERLISVLDWRTVWVIEGLAVWAIVLPIALLGMRDRPSDLGQLPDGAPATEDGGNDGDGARPAPEWGLPLSAALRTPFFWTVAAGVAATGMLATAVAFHQISLLGEHGLSPTEAAANFLPQTVAGLAATLGAGALIDRVRPRWILAGSMLALTAGLLLGTVAGPGLPAIAFALAIGAAGGSIRAVEAATFPRYFGVLHLGAIRGTVSAIGVGSTAFGPVLFAVIHDATGSYTPALLATAVIPLLVTISALLVSPPATTNDNPSVQSADRRA